MNRPLEEIPTPALIIEAAAVKRNIKRLAAYGAEHHLRIRPHTKTHKSRMLGRMQIESGACGLTMAKVGEAEQMAVVSEDLLVAYPAVDPARTTRLGALAREKTLRVAIDTATAVEALDQAARAAGSTIGILVEIDVGMRRTGVATAEESLNLAQLAEKASGLRLDGIMCYPGHIGAPTGEQAPPLAIVAAQLREAIDLWAKHGLRAEIVSGGSTPTAYQSHLVGEYTEIRPGTYIFNDINTVRGGFCEWEDCAARIVCTVVSDAVKNQIVIDAGTKALTSDLCAPARDSGHGYIVEYPGARISRLTEEHGQADVSQCERRPKVGERVTVIPNHICPCVNLQDALWWREADGSARQIAVDARGMLS
jgi:D-serine deaminase-like pyridoxal phosphate-dependent protein